MKRCIDKWHTKISEGVRSAHGLTCVDVEPVANYVSIDNNRKLEYWKLVCRPPWEETWMEYPGFIDGYLHSDVKWIGCFTETREVPRRGDPPDVVILTVKDFDDRVVEIRIDPQDTAAVMDQFLFVGTDHFLRVSFRCLTLLDEFGYMGDMYADSTPWIREIYGRDESKIAAALTVQIYPFQVAFAFLNCKNVEIIDESMPPRKVMQRRKKKKGPYYIFKNLVVMPGQEKKLRPNNTKGHPRRLRLHAVRGHFKDYGNGGGLFGRYKGQYWWQQSTRGDPSIGVVDKDYCVKPNSDKDEE